MAANRYTLPILSGKYVIFIQNVNIDNETYFVGIDATLKKVVSRRGPYDMFTGPRDNTTIKNHFSPSVDKVPEYYFINPSPLDILLHHPSKSR